MRFTRLYALAFAASLASVGAQAADTIKIAYLEPLSGGMANVGEEGAHNFQFVIDQINAAGGALGRKFELVPLDKQAVSQAVEQMAARGLRVIALARRQVGEARLRNHLRHRHEGRQGER